MKGITMFFPFLAATIIGAGAVKLGALSVTVSLLTTALELLVFANLIGAGYFLWQRYSKKSEQQQ
jgi:membrane protein implicated in regulation of membrane protease activity